MQLSGVTKFLLLLLQYGASLCRSTYFSEELRDFEESLIKQIYENAPLDPKEDDEKIETITKAILDEADLRLKKRELVKNHKYRHKDSVDNNGGYNHDRRQHKGVDDAHIKESIGTRYKKQVKEKKIAQNYAISQHKGHSSRKAGVGDNNQIASVEVDNSPDIQTRLTNNAKHLFLEPNLNVSKEENKSSYARHRLELKHPKTIVVHKVDRTRLDRLSFVAVVVSCCVIGIAVFGWASFCWYKLRSDGEEYKNGSTDYKSRSLRNSGHAKKTAEVDKLVLGTEKFHYLHVKKQMKQMEEPKLKSLNHSVSTDDEEEGEDTFYECPGLAPPGDMKVVNPMFSDNESLQ